jgi:DnaJ like chaperone protein
MFFGAAVGFLTTRSVWGAVIGGILGHIVGEGAGPGYSTGASASAASISEVFFRTTFELMGHVAKSDGRVSEAEIDAARRMMQELMLGPNEVAAAIASFHAGKSSTYDVNSAIGRLREACGQRRDLLRSFVELQLRAALAGNGMSPPARAVLVRAAERLGLSSPEFARMEAALRARHGSRSQGGGWSGGPNRTSSSDSLASCYAELEVAASSSNQEVTKAYRRQMSRHHPDKLVANGLPESMAQVAKERTQRIQEAYEEIRAARGMR